MTNLNSAGHPLISIIAPVYNAGPALSGALESLRNLSYPNTELLIVNDGSTDGTWDVATAFAERHKWAQAINAPRNLGAAAARNLGLHDASGEYLWFVDWDDEWDSGILDRLMAEMQRENADLVACVGTWRLASGIDVGTTDGTRVRRVLNGGAALEMLLAGKLQGYLWNKLIRREVLSHDPFPPLATHEDLVAIAELLPRCRTVVTVPDRLYHHVIREGSLTNTRDPNLHDKEVARSAVHRAAAELPDSRRRGRLLSHFDTVHYTSRVSTALRLSSPGTANAMIDDLRASLTWTHILQAARISPRTSARAALMKALGEQYRHLRSFTISLRTQHRALRERARRRLT